MSDGSEKLLKELERRKAEDEAKAAEKADSDSHNSSHRRHRHHHHHDPKARRRRRRRRKLRKVKKIMLRTLIFLGVIILIAAVTVFVMRHTGKNEMTAEDFNIKAPESLDVQISDKGSHVVFEGKQYEYNKDIICMLILGIDQVSGVDDRQIGDNMQSDLIALCAIDSVNKKITIINIPRDIITDVKVYSPSGGYVEMKKLPIAEAFAYGDGKKGSCFNSAEAVSKLFYNLPIRTFFALNLDGIAELTDSVGGVDVVSPETIGEFEKGESYHLEGKKATNFVRRRATDRADANLLRNDRQKEYLKSIINKFFKATRSNISVPVNVFNAVQSYSSTNLNPDRVTYLATEFIVNRNMDRQFKSVPVTVKQVDNHAENYVKEKEFYKMFLDIFYNEK